MTIQERFLKPTIDGLFENLSAEQSLYMALAILKRHVIVSEKDGSYIAYHYAKDAAAEVIINSLYNAYSANTAIPLEIKRKAIGTYNKANDFVSEHILPDGFYTGALVSIEDIDRDAVPELIIPGFTVLDGVIMPETQMEWAAKRTFEHVNISQHIVDAMYFDQNIIFLVGPVTNDPVFIGNILQNDVVNIMFADQDFNMLSANTYRLS